jgi:phosphate:Na+ symporter
MASALISRCIFGPKFPEDGLCPSLKKRVPPTQARSEHDLKQMEISVIVTIAPLLAGLGLFFSGVHLISANLTPLAGKRFRRLLTRATMYPSLGALTGILAGIVTQSTNAVTHVTISMVAAGVIDKRRAMPIPIWAHVGASLLVMLVAVNLQIGASYIIALSGFAIYLGIDRADQIRHMIATFLGIGLLFLGIEMLKSGAGPLRDFIVGEGLFAEATRHPAILLLLGIGLTVISQSSTVTGAISVTAANIGLVDLPGACLLIYGANLGSGISHIVLARSLRDEGRQIALMQAVQKLFGFLAVVAVLLIEWLLDQPLLAPAVTALANTVPGQVAWVFLLYQIAGSTICSLFLPRLVSLLERLLPPTKLEMLAKPMFLSDEALFEPSLALDLAVREERRLLQRLPSMLDRVRVDGDARGTDSETLKTASIAVLRAMSRYLDGVMEAGPAREDIEKLMRLQHRTTNLSSLYDSLDEFVAAAGKSRQWESSGRVADQMIEAMHALLGALVDATASEDATEQQLVLSMLGHRDELMERMRRRVLQENPDLPAEAQETLFATTMLFERIVWLARRNALLILPEATNGPASLSASARAG